jgi:hypothetical protein
VLRFALAAVLALSGLKLLDVPYANQIVVVSLGAGLVALAVWGIRQPQAAHAGRAARADPTGADAGPLDLVAAGPRTALLS